MTKKEQIIKRKEYQKNYRETHKNKRLEYDKKYYLKNKDKIIQASKDYKACHKEHYRELDAEYRNSHKEEARLYKKEYQIKNKDKIKEHKRQVYLKNKKLISKKHKKYYETHKKQIKEYDLNRKEFKKFYMSNYRKNHSKQAKIIFKKWRISNKKELREYKNYKYRTDVNYRITVLLRGRLRLALNGICKSKSTLKLLGCSLEYFKTYYEDKFQDGMNWDKVMSGEIHIDHIKPCASFDLSKPSHQRKCFHYTNLQPLWAIDNMKKGAR